jgi:hypothetical protein
LAFGWCPGGEGGIFPVTGFTLFFCSALDIIFNNSIHTMKENKFDKKGIKNRSPL